MGFTKKLIKYSLDEIKMAEKYVVLAMHMEDPAVCQKLVEMAKDELKHYDYLDSLLHKEKTTDEHELEHMVSTYEDITKDWKDEVMFKISNFQLKK